MILKKKIQRAISILNSKSRNSSHKKVSNKQCHIIPERKPESYLELLQSKNLFKNFGRAICSFILSEISNSYRDSLLQQFEVEESEFNKYVLKKKSEIIGLNEFEDLFLARSQDNDKVLKFKKLLAALARVFIKYFSVNWIVHGKIQYKLSYLKFRNKILRKIQSLETISPVL